MSLRSRLIVLLAASFSLGMLEAVAQETYVCVWRNPETTMKRIFKAAKDYRSLTREITPEQRQAIEKELGLELLPGQRDIFQYYEMVGEDNEVIGFVIAASQKGTYGAIEFVFGMGVDLKINGIYIQRARERDKEFKKREFLDSFLGKGAKEVVAMKYGEEIEAKETSGTQSVLNGIKKELITFDLIVGGSLQR